MGQGGGNAARWMEEARHFDVVADRRADGLAPLDPAILSRYRRPTGLYAKEYAIQVLGDLRGKRVLDVGCGDGENAVLLARLGAVVTGIDVSPKIVALANSRARLDGVADRAHFICAPLESASLPERHFDVIWAAHVLHHLLPVLEDTLKRLVWWARPGGTFVALEPVNLNPTLRRLRSLLSIPADGTPGERPLVQAELDELRRHLPDLQTRHFGLLDWFDRFVLGGFRYETASLSRRAIADSLARGESALLSNRWLKRFGSVAVMHGVVPW